MPKKILKYIKKNSLNSINSNDFISNQEKSNLFNLNTLHSANSYKIQVEKINKERLKYIDQLNELISLEVIKQEQLELFDKQMPINYINFNDTLFEGYNKFNQLITIMDKKQNIIYFNYDKNENIEYLEDNNGKKVEFEYDKSHKLIKAINAYNQVVDLKNKNNILSSITYEDLVTEFIHKNKELTRIVDSNLSLNFDYASDKVIKIKQLSNLKYINDNKIETINNLTMSKITLDYPYYNTTNVKKYNEFNKEISNTTYYFDNFGRPLTIKDDKENYLSCEYQNDEKVYSISSDASAKEVVPFKITETLYGGLTSDSIKSFEIPLEQFDDGIQDYILIATALGDSAKLSDTRKFEVRIEATYSGDVKPTVFSVPFDYLITGYQTKVGGFTINNYNNSSILPIALPFRLKSKLLKVEVILDYSNNINSAIFKDISIKRGKYNYRILDESDRVIMEEDNINYRTLSEEELENNIANDSITKKYYEYDSNDNVIKEVIEQGNKEYTNTYLYDRNNLLLKSVDYNGIETINNYDAEGSLLASTSYNKLDPTLKYFSKYNNDPEERKENSTEHGYSKDGLTATSNGNSSNLTSYKSGVVTRITSSSDNTIDYSYDYVNSNDNEYIDNKIIVTTINDQEYLTTNISKDKVVNTYNNGEEFITNFNNDNLIDNVTYNGIELSSNQYDKYNNLIVHIDNNNGVDYYFDYDSKSRLTNASYIYNNKSVSKSINYANNNLLDNITYNIDGIELIYSYIYSEGIDRQLKKISTLNYNSKVKYDLLSRVKEVTIKSFDNRVKVSNKYDYLKVNESTTNIINNHYIKVNDELTTLSYTYDNNGNIVKIKEDGLFKVHYTYDSKNQLIRVDDKELSSTSVYNYDNAGNIISKIEYPFTLISDLDHLEVSNVITYKYNKDKLMGVRDFNDINYLFEYNNITGNPTTYKGHILSWDKVRLLTNYGSNQYYYNSSGIRTKKSVNGVVTNYYLDGSKILVEEIENEYKLIYNYGIDNTYIGFTYIKDNIKEDYYKKNILNDIIGIVDSKGILIAEYHYNEYGCVEVDNHSNECIGDLNPIRYRSYYQDSETSLYYLNSRYYDPAIGRFISPDALEYLDPKTINGLNLYAYCLNNPVMYFDRDGNSAIPIFNPTLNILTNFLKKFLYDENGNFRLRNHVHKTSTSFSIANLGPIWGSLTYTGTKSHNSSALFYSSTRYNSSNQQIGIGTGVNLFGIIGGEVYATGESFDKSKIGGTMKIGVVSFGGSIGLDGIGIQGGLSVGNVTHSLSLNIGWGTIGLAAVTVAAVLTAPIWMSAIVAAAPVLATAAVIIGVGIAAYNVIDNIGDFGNSVINNTNKVLSNTGKFINSIFRW